MTTILCLACRRTFTTIRAEGDRVFCPHCGAACVIERVLLEAWNERVRDYGHPMVEAATESAE